MLKIIFIVLLSGHFISCATLPKSQLLGASIGLGVGAIIGNIIINSSQKQYSPYYSGGLRNSHRKANQNKNKLTTTDKRRYRGNFCYSGPPVLHGYGCSRVNPSKINFGFIIGPLIGYYLSKKVHFYFKKKEQKNFLIDLQENMIELPQSFERDWNILKNIPKNKKKKLFVKKIKSSSYNNNWNTINFEGLE